MRAGNTSCTHSHGAPWESMRERYSEGEGEEDKKEQLREGGRKEGTKGGKDEGRERGREGGRERDARRGTFSWKTRYEVAKLVAIWLKEEGWSETAVFCCDSEGRLRPGVTRSTLGKRPAERTAFSSSGESACTFAPQRAAKRACARHGTSAPNSSVPRRRGQRVNQSSTQPTHLHGSGSNSSLQERGSRCPRFVLISS